MTTPEQCLEAFIKYGTKADAARALAIPRTTLSDRLKLARGYGQLKSGILVAEPSAQQHAGSYLEQNAAQDDAILPDYKPLDLSKGNTLIFSCLHAPYNHPDALRFLEAVKNLYKPSVVVCLGDEIDNHAISYHDHNPNLPSAGDELEMARNVLFELERIFPKMTLLHSNHGGLPYRKAISNGIPRGMILDERDIIFGNSTERVQNHGRGEGWLWKPCLQAIVGGRNCTMTHQAKKQTILNAKNTGGSYIQGHWHSTFAVEYINTNNAGTNFGMTVGCLIDDYRDYRKDPFQYNKTQVERPIIGCGVLVAGEPTLVRMPIRNNRWTGKIFG